MDDQNHPLNFTKVVVTPAGRKRYLQILIKYMVKAKNENQFDRWDLWLNTNVAENIEYCEYLAKTYSWINVVRLERYLFDINFPGYQMTNIFKFFRYASDRRSIYVRIDDDVVYLEPKFFKKFFDFRCNNPEPFLVYGNIINNAIISHLHQRNVSLNMTYPHKVEYNYSDPVGVSDHKFCEHIHNKFINDVKNNQIDKWRTSFNVWKLYANERVSVNCVSWFGISFSDLAPIILNNDNIDEEGWLSVGVPAQFNKFNVIYNDAIVAHLAFYTQRERLEAETDILQKYEELSNFI
jgi:hypothetical protein